MTEQEMIDELIEQLDEIEISQAELNDIMAQMLLAQTPKDAVKRFLKWLKDKFD